MKIYKVNELFDASDKVYPYKLEKNTNFEFRGRIYRYDSMYSFISDDNTKYIVDVSYFNNGILSVGFADEANYIKGKTKKWKYKLTNKHDAIKVINTVIKIVKDISEEKEIKQFGFNTAKNRLETYKYILQKYFKGWEMFIEKTKRSRDPQKERFDVICKKPYGI